jgi:hypothetical protein
MLAAHVSVATSLPRAAIHHQPLLMMHIMRFSLHTWAVLIASVFLLLTLYLSFSLIFAHLTNYNNPGVCIYCFLYRLHIHLSYTFPIINSMPS